MKISADEMVDLIPAQHFRVIFCMGVCVCIDGLWSEMTNSTI